MRINNLSEFIVLIPGAITPEKCSEIIELYRDNHRWHWAKTSNGVDFNHRKVRELHISDPVLCAEDSAYGDMDRFLFETFGSLVKAYIEEIAVRASPSFAPEINSDEGYNFLHYTEGYYFKEHTDAGAGLDRTLTCTLNISDDHEGGIFSFLGDSIRHHLKAGDAILFPSTFLFPHEVTEITSGERFAIVTWFK